jgi:hypothetical protein
MKDRLQGACRGRKKRHATGQQTLQPSEQAGSDRQSDPGVGSCHQTVYIYIRLLDTELDASRAFISLRSEPDVKTALGESYLLIICTLMRFACSLAVTCRVVVLKNAYTLQSPESASDCRENLLIK